MSHPDPVVVSDVAGAAELKRQRRLEHLLATRDRLAAVAAVYEAHRLGDPEEIRRVQYATEFVIGTEFAGVYQRLCGGWATRDLELMHDGPGKRSPDCPICCGRPGPDPNRILAPKAA